MSLAMTMMQCLQVTSIVHSFTIIGKLNLQGFHQQLCNTVKTEGGFKNVRDFHVISHPKTDRSKFNDIFSQNLNNWSERLACAVTELSVHYKWRFFSSLLLHLSYFLPEGVIVGF